MSRKTLASTLAFTLAAIPVLLSATFAATHDFTRDYVCKGSSLAGWHALGQASWRPENGEISSTPQTPDGAPNIINSSVKATFISGSRCARRARPRGKKNNS
jgi:hypothetical protein